MSELPHNWFLSTPEIGERVLPEMDSNSKLEPYQL